VQTNWGFVGVTHPQILADVWALVCRTENSSYVVRAVSEGVAVFSDVRRVDLFLTTLQLTRLKISTNISQSSNHYQNLIEFCVNCFTFRD
jgi:hypothetical protein